MNTFLSLLGTYTQFAVWQATFWLAAAWILGRFYRQTPWKAHFLCVIGIFVATFTPLLSTIISATSGGLLKNSVPQWIEPQTLGMICLAGTLLFVVVLSYGITTSRKLMFHAVPYPDRESQDALLRHSKTLRNVSLPILFTSPSVKSPTVWCWGLHPAVLLPETLAEKLLGDQRDAVFLHELSHIIRRDHLTSLFARLCGAVLFWNPLYWLVLWESDLAADESCDLLVLTQGKMHPEQYTETLLRLVAGERPRPIFQFLSRKEKIMRRIDRILSFENLLPIPSPAGSRLWTASVFLTALLLSVTLAFCQEKKTPLKEPGVEPVLRRSPRVTEPFENAANPGATASTPAPPALLGSETTSLAKEIDIDSLKPYRVDKRIADFPDKIDLSSPEAAYVTQKHLIVSNAKDKLEKIMKMNFHQGEISKRERKFLESEVNAEWAKTFKNESIVFEVIPFGKDRAFVFGLRRFDMLYDGNYFQKKEDGLWYNQGNDQAMEAAQMASRVKKAISREMTTESNSIKDLIHIDGMESYRIDKRIIDFPDKFDLSSPEAAYATQKHLIVSNAEDKFDMLEKMQFGGGKFPERERREMSEKVSADWQKTYKTEFVVYEVLKYKPNLAFVFALRKFDKLYDGNLFQKKDDGLWYNLGNFQDFNLADMAENIENAPLVYGGGAENIERKLSEKQPERITSYRVDKKVTEFPANVIDLSTPETAYVLGNRIIAGDETDRVERLRQYSVNMNVPKDIMQWIETMSSETKALMKNAEILHVFIYKDKSAMVIAEVVKGEKYNNRLFTKQDGKWFNVGGGGLYNGKSGEDVVKMCEGLFTKLADGWDKAKEEKPWKTPDVVGHTFLATFTAAGDFKPATAQELLDKLNGPLFKRNNIVTGYFRTAMDGERMVGRICTNNPTALREVFKESPELKLIKLEPLNEKSFEEHLGEKIVKDADAPVVTKMEPANGATDVDAKTVKELRVTFDVDMNTTSFSWCGGGETFPKTTDKPKWIDKRTCVLPVELEPGKNYRLGINAPSFKGFQNAAGVPVEPLTYKFSTK